MNVTLVLVLAVACLLPATVHGDAILRMYEAQQTSITKYPFMAIVAYGSQLVGNGVIIAPNWVLTAASTLLSPPESEYCAVLGGNTISTGKYYQLHRVYKHPEWVGSDHNAALLHLRRKIKYGPTMQPIPISYSNAPGGPVLMLSYGQNEKGERRLQKSDYLLTSDRDCVNSLDDYHSRVTVANGHGYCIKSPPGTNKLFWANDVGAPALNANNELVGLLSLAEFANQVPYGFVATRLGQHQIRSWIDSMLRM